MSSIDPNRNMVCAAVDLPRLGTIYSEVKGPPERVVEMGFTSDHCTEVRFTNFFSSGFITAIVVNALERRLAKHISVHCTLYLSGLLYNNKPDLTNFYEIGQVIT